MRYVEMSIEEALKRCNKNAKVLVSIKDLENIEDDIIFVKKGKKDYDALFQDVQTVASLCDNFVKQLQLYTVKQDIYNIKPLGIQKIVLLKE